MRLNMLTLIEPLQSTFLLLDIAAVALGKDESREEIEKYFITLESSSCQIKNPIHQIWAGERDPSILMVGLKFPDSAIINRILEIIATT